MKLWDIVGDVVLPATPNYGQVQAQYHAAQAWHRAHTWQTWGNVPAVGYPTLADIAASMYQAEGKPVAVEVL